MGLDYTQTVHHMPQFVPWVDLEFLVIPDWIIAEICGLVGCCSLLLYQFHSQSERLGLLRLDYLQWSDVFCVSIVHVMYLGCSLETLDWCFQLVICKVIRGCVVTLGIVWILFVHFYVFDLSLATVLVVWILPAQFWKVSKSSAMKALLIEFEGPAFFSGFVGSEITVLTVSVLYL